MREWARGIQTGGLRGCARGVLTGRNKGTTADTRKEEEDKAKFITASSLRLLYQEVIRGT